MIKVLEIIFIKCFREGYYVEWFIKIRKFVVFLRFDNSLVGWRCVLLRVWLWVLFLDR